MIGRTLLLPVLALVAFAPAQTQRFEGLQGKQLPPFSLQAVDGKTLSTQSLRGRVVLLDFWATWCGPCKAASPVMQRLHETYGAKGLTVIGANTSDPAAASRAYAKKHGYTYAFASGADPYSKKIGVQGIPAFIVVDRKGKVVLATAGFHPVTTPKAIEDAIKKAL